MEQPKIDLPDLSSNHVYNDKDALLTESSIITPESLKSVDTGFVSDDTRLDSPSPLSEKAIPFVEEKEPIQSVDSNRANETDNSMKNETQILAENKDKVHSNSLEINGVETTDLSNESNEINTSTESTNPGDIQSTIVTETNSLQTQDTAEDKTSKIKETQDVKDEGDEYIDILGNGLLKKKVLTPGAGTDSRPTNECVVRIKFKGCLDDGTQVEDEEMTFTLNEGDVIVAFELAVALMELGEKCELFTSSRYAYGDLGKEPDIPKDANITYVIELMDIKPPVDVSTLSCDERLGLGEKKRERGNYLFKRTDYSGAINSYNKAVKMLDDHDLNAGLDEANRAMLLDCASKCYNNMAACQLKIEALDAAIRSCEQVLSYQSDNVKALYRLGKAYGSKGEVDKAISNLKKAIKLDPESKILHSEMLILTRRKNKEIESERMLYQKMFGVESGGKKSAKSEAKKNSSSVLKWTLGLGAVTAAMVSIGLTLYRNS